MTGSEIISIKKCRYLPGLGIFSSRTLEAWFNSIYNPRGKDVILKDALYVFMKFKTHGL